MINLYSEDKVNICLHIHSLIYIVGYGISNLYHDVKINLKIREGTVVYNSNGISRDPYIYIQSAQHILMYEMLYKKFCQPFIYYL